MLENTAQKQMYELQSAQSPVGVKSDTHKQDLSDNPFERVWRGNREGTIKMSGVPRFDDKYEEREWVKCHMTAAFRYWGKLGFGEGTAGHITVRDPVLPDHYCADTNEALKKSDLVLVGPDGYVTAHGAQHPINEAGYVIRKQSFSDDYRDVKPANMLIARPCSKDHTIHRRRPDVVAAAHCHSIYGKSWSAFGKPIDILQQDGCLFYDNLSVYSSYGGIVLSDEEGENIAAALGPRNKACIMKNHGLLTCSYLRPAFMLDLNGFRCTYSKLNTFCFSKVGNTIDECVYLFSLLEKQCKLQLLVEAAAANGIPKSIISDEDASYTAQSNGHWETMYLNVGGYESFPRVLSLTV